MNQLAVYIRVSTEKQVNEGNGLDVQLIALNNFAKEHGSKITEYYIERGKSAVSKKRPEYDRLFRDIVSGKIKWLMVYKRDRLIRDVIDMFEVNEVLVNKCGCRVESIIEGKLSWTNAGDKFVHTIMAAKDRLEVEQVSERTKDALYASAFKGNYTNSLMPIGFKRCIRGDAKKAIEPNQILVPGIVRLFNLIASDEYNCNSVCMIANAEKLADETNWTEEKVRKIIRNELYIGNFVSKRWRIDNHMPAMIEKSLFDKANEAVSKHKRKRIHTYVFDSVFCVKCGSKLVKESTVSKKKNTIIFVYYRCEKCRTRISQKSLIKSVEPFIFERLNCNSKEKSLKNEMSYNRNLKLKILNASELLSHGRITLNDFKSQVSQIFDTKYHCENDNYQTHKSFDKLSLLAIKEMVAAEIESIHLLPVDSIFRVKKIIFTQNLKK